MCVHLCVCVYVCVCVCVYVCASVCVCTEAFFISAVMLVRTSEVNEQIAPLQVETNKSFYSCSHKQLCKVSLWLCNCLSVYLSICVFDESVWKYTCFDIIMKKKREKLCMDLLLCFCCYCQVLMDI